MVEVYSLKLIQMKAEAGEEYFHDLKVSNPTVEDKTKQRTVELFSTDP